MEKLDISLGGRSYPLTLSPNEVDVVQEAAKAVEAQIAQLKSQYAISDRIDLMAMAALQIAVQAQAKDNLPKSQSPESQSTAESAWPSEQIDHLLQRIQSAL